MPKGPGWVLFLILMAVGNLFALFFTVIDMMMWSSVASEYLHQRAATWDRSILVASLAAFASLFFIRKYRLAGTLVFSSPTILFALRTVLGG